MAKERTDLELLEEVLKKIKTIYPNKFLIFNDSIMINEYQTSKNAGECDGTIVIHLKDIYKDAIRRLFYNDTIEENIFLHITDMNELRKIITECKDSPEEFYMKIYHDVVRRIPKKNFDFEYNRLCHEINRGSDMLKFKKFDFSESSEEYKTFVDDKDAIELSFEHYSSIKKENVNYSVVLSSANVPLLNKKNVNEIEYYIDIEKETEWDVILFVTFYLEIEIFRIFSTYHFV